MTAARFENPPPRADPKSRCDAAAGAPVLQFERSDISLFRNLATLAQKAGVPQHNLVKLAFKELADNALDAGAHVTFEHTDDGLTWVKDDGDGIDGSDGEIAALFSIGRPLRSSKLLRLPTRGALGNGLRVVAGLVLCTGGRLVVRTRGRDLDLQPQDNGDTIVRSSTTWAGSGTAVGVRFGVPTDDMLDWAQLSTAFTGEESYRGASSPWWYDSDSFFELCAAAPPGLSVRALVERLDGCSGRKAGIIAAEFLNREARVLKREEAERLLFAARENAKPVTSRRLGAVGELGERPGYGKSVDTVVVAGRAFGLCKAELPVVVEAWARAAQGSVARVLVNRTVSPAAMAAQNFGKHVCVSGCGYLGESLPSGGRDYEILINVQTPHMPITSDGKAPDLGRFKSLLDEAIRTAVNRAKRAAGIVREEPTIRFTFKDSVLDHLDEAIDKASGSCLYRFNLRNLFYQVRPFVLQEVGELAYATFTNIITDYENDYGPIEGMYRNERGVLIHPHSGETIPLGTLAVEKYERPSWTFNKVLYVEKEGFFQTLRAAGWPERHDCALVTSQGFASRAARDLIDALGETDEPIEFFCVHDADAFGTTIFESLQEATRARPERKVTIVNLGLERAEAEAMGLECETLPESTRDKPTAAYVSADDHEWYQTHRFELNAMTAPQLIAWLDAKMAKHAAGKVVPPQEVLYETLDREVRDRVRDAVRERIIREAKIDESVDARMAGLSGVIVDLIDGAAKSLGSHVQTALEETPTSGWDAAISDLAARLADEVKP